MECAALSRTSLAKATLAGGGVRWEKTPAVAQHSGAYTRATDSSIVRSCRMQSVHITAGELDHPSVIALLQRHRVAMHENSPPGSVFALDLAGLKTPENGFYTAWQDGELLGMGALKELDPLTGEIKSMRTDTKHLRK